jgi:hypothetical protein
MSSPQLANLWSCSRTHPPSAIEKDRFVMCTGMTERRHAESGIPPASRRTLCGRDISREPALGGFNVK